MVLVEIRWYVDRMRQEGSGGFESYLRRTEGTVTPVAVEETIKSWLKEKVEGKDLIVSDVEVLVDGKFYILEREEENKLFQRIGAAAGR